MIKCNWPNPFPRKTDSEARREKLARITAAQDGRCFYCRQVTDDRTLDHVTPYSHGGSLRNAVMACRSCNSRKGTRSIDEFRSYERLRRRDGNFRLAFDPPRQHRDWLMIYSDRSIPALFKASNGAKQ